MLTLSVPKSCGQNLPEILLTWIFNIFKSRLTDFEILKKQNVHHIRLQTDDLQAICYTVESPVMDTSFMWTHLVRGLCPGLSHKQTATEPKPKGL